MKSAQNVVSLLALWLSAIRDVFWSNGENEEKALLYVSFNAT